MAFGGGTKSGRPIKAVQAGGPLGGYITPENFDVAMGYETLAEAKTMLGHGGLVVFNDTANMLNLARYAWSFVRLNLAESAHHVELVQYVAKKH
jgi:formate dehydrogenase iron-sulfur subunit